jgi:putative ABC transport system permease protein
MLRHAFKLAWKRKRASALLLLEFAAVFLVLAALAMIGLTYLVNARGGVGFTVDRVWRVSVAGEQAGSDRWTGSQTERFARMLEVARAQPYVEAVAGAEFSPYEMSASTGAFRRPGGTFEYNRNEVTDGFADLLGLRLTRGRWFSREDDGASHIPAVVTERFVREYYQNTSVTDPLGREIEEFSGDLGKPVRIVGVVEEFRQSGQYIAPNPYLFWRNVAGDTTRRPPNALLVRVRPGTSEGQLGDLIETLSRALPGVDFDGQTLARQQASFEQLVLLPLAIAGIVGFFFLLMVALGLIGILWQSLIRRTAEMGLRRALGAARRDVSRQVVLEVIGLATLGAVLGVLVAGHFPLMGLFDLVPPPIFVGGLVLGVLGLFAAVTLCALYPARLATRLHPAEALRTE